ncbi:MAG: transporter substrate-binding protein [Betaproteobacteria bacterium]|nr:transporter substrate-binding protein [Betaproteobacteria bacterium]
MKPTKTNGIRVFVATAILAWSAVTQAAQSYPTRPIRFVNGSPSGGPTDAAGRIIGEALSQVLGQTVVNDSRPGADGAIAPELVARAPPDGYTLLLGNQSSMAGVPAMRKKLPYDPIADFAPIAFIAWNSGLLVVHPAVSARTIAELVEYARANPGKLNFAAASPPAILTAALLKSTAKPDMVNVAYKGDVAAMPDLLSGRVHVGRGGMNLLLPYVKDGRLRALAVTMRNRSRVLPELPTMAEAGFPGFSIYGWFALFGPTKMPTSIVERLEREVNAVLKRPDIQDQYNKIGFEMGGPSRQELAAFVKEQIEAWAAAARDAGIQPQ